MTPKSSSPVSDFTRLLKVRHKGFLSVCVYLNSIGGTKYYDVVIRRRVKRKGGEQEWVRGANLKPTDLPDLLQLLEETRDHLKELVSS